MKIYFSIITIIIRISKTKYNSDSNKNPIQGNNNLESHNRTKKEFINLKNTRVSTTSRRREEASPSIDFCCSDRFDIICREKLFL